MSSQCLIENDPNIAVYVSELTPFLVSEYEGSWSWELVSNVLSHPSSNSLLVQCMGGYYIGIFTFGSDVVFHYIRIDEPIISAFFGKVYASDLGTLYMVSDNWVWVSQTWDLNGGGIRCRRNSEFETEYSLTMDDPITLVKYYIEILTGPNPCFGEDEPVVDYEKYALTFNENSEIFNDDAQTPEDS